MELCIVRMAWLGRFTPGACTSSPSCMRCSGLLIMISSALCHDIHTCRASTQPFLALQSRLCQQSMHLISLSIHTCRASTQTILATQTRLCHKACRLFLQHMHLVAQSRLCHTASSLSLLRNHGWWCGTQHLLGRVWAWNLGITETQSKFHLPCFHGSIHL